jgi:hypothetical protein
MAGDVLVATPPPSTLPSARTTVKSAEEDVGVPLAGDWGDQSPE